MQVAASDPFIYAYYAYYYWTNSTKVSSIT